VLFNYFGGLDMEDTKKKAVMIAVVIACLAAAGVVTYVTSSGGGGGIETIERGQLMWVKCNNPDCGAEYQIDQRDYYKYLEEHPQGPGAPAMVCEKCKEESVFRAEKCEKCGTVFFYESVADDLPDRCPSCGYSKMEEKRKAAREARQQGK
jgi:DNA-directed RNA polymerase subunit RPC12/RpoP